MQQPARKTYTMTGGPRGLPGLGMIVEVIHDPLEVLAASAVRYGDIIPFRFPGMNALQLNHPDLIRHVLIDNHKNYRKSMAYRRFETAVGQGLITSNGEKWRRDRQTIQPLFKREQIEGYYFEVVNKVSEKYKQRWLELTQNGPAEIDITLEMASITMEVILKTLFGKDNLTASTIHLLHASFNEVLSYLKRERLFPNADFRKLFHMPSSYRYRRAMANIHGVIDTLSQQYRRGELSDRNNMLALLIEAQRQDPEHFTEQDIIDQSVTMIFGGFETTANTLQWLWYLLDTAPEVEEKLRAELMAHVPCVMQKSSEALSYDSVIDIPYLNAVLKETLRLYPPFWLTSRQPIEDDTFGDFKVKSGTVVVVSQLVMHRHPRFWDRPNAFLPERFLGGKEAGIDPGLYFPFSQGPRKCMGAKFAEMEAKTVMAKLVPLFKVKPLNMLGNTLDPGISLKLKHPLRAEISRA